MFNISNILVSPKEKKQLYFNIQSESLVSEESEFKIIEGIPILLPNGTVSNYVEHYQKDAIFFDYFEKKFYETVKEEERVHQYVFSRIPPSAKLIADIGCGNGWLARRLLLANRVVVSVDVSLENVKKVLNLYNDENHFGVVADGYFLPFKDNSFDCVVCSEVLEHLHKPLEFLNEILRVTKNNGKIILTTPYKEKIRYTLCIHCNRPTPWNAHINSFDEEFLNEIVKNLSFKNYRYFKFGNALVQYLRLYRVLSIFPFVFWKIFDSIINRIYHRPKHWLIEIIK
ncbi:MAG: class I SAM-dependent methyltransferase [Ignavibacteria bacterium]|nr:class I SAM-dependent methyltransferase [Ignavibacteria bacterium]